MSEDLGNNPAAAPSEPAAEIINDSLIPEGTAAPAEPVGDPSPAEPAADPAPAAPVEFTEDWQMGKYATPEDLAASHKSLREKLGNFTGAPEDGIYNFTFAEELGEVELDLEGDMVTNFTKMATNANMNQDVANDLMNMHLTEMNKLKASYQPDTDAEIASIENFEERVNKVADWGNQNLTKDEFAVLRTLVASKSELEFFEGIISKVNKVPSLTVHTRPVKDSLETQTELMDLQAKTAADPTPLNVKKLKEAYARVHGTAAVG